MKHKQIIIKASLIVIILAIGYYAVNEFVDWFLTPLRAMIDFFMDMGDWFEGDFVDFWEDDFAGFFDDDVKDFFEDDVGNFVKDDVGDFVKDDIGGEIKDTGEDFIDLFR